MKERVTGIVRDEFGSAWFSDGMRCFASLSMARAGDVMV